MAPQLATRKANRPAFNWPPEQKLDIMAKFNDNWSMGEIAFKYETKRSAIAGLISRMRKQHDIPMKKVGLKPGAKAKGAPKGRPIAVKPPKPKKRLRLKLIDSNTAVTFAELRLHHCRWPVGDPRLSDFRFCGCPRVSESSRTPYCEQHTLKASRNQELASR